MKTIVPAWTASLNVAVRAEPTATAVAPEAGFVAVTVGAVVSGAAAVVKVHDAAVIVLPAGSLAPLSVAVYAVP